MMVIFLLIKIFRILLRLCAIHARLNSVLTFFIPLVRNSLSLMFCLILPNGYSAVIIRMLYFRLPSLDFNFLAMSLLSFSNSSLLITLTPYLLLTHCGFRTHSVQFVPWYILIILPLYLSL